MRHSRLRLRTILIVAALAGAFTATAWASAGSPFTGDICSLIGPKGLSAAEVTGGCVQNKSASRTVSMYSAHWGVGGSAHYLAIIITKPAVNSEFYYEMIKQGASRDRAPIALGQWAYWKTERYNGDRRRGDIQFRVGPYLCLVSINDDNGAPDETGIATALFAVSKTLVAKLK